MRYLLSILLVGAVIGSTAQAQQPLTDIKAPSSPAASLLGVQPQSVLAPKSYQALETGVYSNFLNNEGQAVIPNDFGLEFTPYWANDHSLTLEEYLYPENVFQGQILRNSSISVATTQNYTLGDGTATTGLGFGYRTTLHFPNQQDREQVSNFREQLSQNQAIQAAVGAQINAFPFDTTISNKMQFINEARTVISEAVHDIYGEYFTPDKMGDIIDQIFSDVQMLLEYNPETPAPFMDAFMNMLDTNLPVVRSEQNAEAVFQHFEDYIRDRQGFSLDIAYGVFMNFPSSNFQSAAAPRQSVWITPTYRFKDDLNRLKIMGVLRYEGYDTDYFKRYFPNSEVYRSNFDYGVAISGNFSKFTLEFEAVGRSSNALIPAGTDNSGNQLFRKDNNSDFQAIGTFLYRLNDRIALTYSLGSRFEPIINPDNTLVSLLSLNLGFGGPTRDNILD